MKKNIVHLYYNLLLTPKEIAPLILSPRKASSGVDVRTVQGVLDFFETYHHVEDLLRAPPALKMPQTHKTSKGKAKAPPSKYAALSSRGARGKEESDTDTSDDDEDDEDQDVDSTITVQVFLAKKPDVGKGPVFDPNAQCVSVTVTDSVRLHNDPLGEDTFTELIITAVEKAGGRLDHPSTNGDYT